ncbi:SDR family oxidoreductase [Streptomyces capillispiralis]|uniref:NADP-dependent 3-hydroxy acid dehydrogenase YdfG n=1 Tax=Streptomyces capillispiralis TaxID=68182 RepID=A0A561TAK3_9ACTN|nr:SDR family NAD(P)-dependent oxidoreductase [Streptomyces capillispiralis]TWF84132.1 NADP-dependent 3-hydroxy acid dehydrogenase YdfG [Streptomyces capillispiralis]GHH92973.1 oxidoreductase [Streptomyces capillispiralis]
MTDTQAAASTRPARTAVVTGAGSGIGAATARALAREGYEVVLTARRADRLEAVAKEIQDQGGSARVSPLDVTDRAAVQAFAEQLPACDVLVNNAGGAYGTEYVEHADPGDWRSMYEVNVLGALHMTQALLPRLRASGDGVVVVLSSTASFTCYEGGGGYSAAKHGAHVLAETLRLEVCGEQLRVVEVAPGMVHTEEFSLNRYRGDTDKADAVYAGVAEPLVADDVADVVTWAVTRPPHVNIDLLVVRPRAQAAQHKVHRTA